MDNRGCRNTFCRLLEEWGKEEHYPRNLSRLRKQTDGMGTVWSLWRRRRTVWLTTRSMYLDEKSECTVVFADWRRKRGRRDKGGPQSNRTLAVEATTTTRLGTEYERVRREKVEDKSSRCVYERQEAEREHVSVHNREQRNVWWMTIGCKKRRKWERVEYNQPANSFLIKREKRLYRDHCQEDCQREP